MKSYENTINKFVRSLSIKWNFSLVYKLKRIKTFFTGLRNVQKSNERRVYICVFWKKVFPPVVFSKFNIHKNFDRYIYVESTHIEHEKIYKRHTFWIYKKIPPATLFKFYVKISFTYFFFLCFPFETYTLTVMGKTVYKCVRC